MALFRARAKMAENQDKSAGNTGCINKHFGEVLSSVFAEALESEL